MKFTAAVCVLGALQLVAAADNKYTTTQLSTAKVTVTSAYETYVFATTCTPTTEYSYVTEGKPSGTPSTIPQYTSAPVYPSVTSTPAAPKTSVPTAAATAMGAPLAGVLAVALGAMMI